MSQGIWIPSQNVDGMTIYRGAENNVMFLLPQSSKGNKNCSSGMSQQTTLWQHLVQLDIIQRSGNHDTESTTTTLEVAPDTCKGLQVIRRTLVQSIRAKLGKIEVHRGVVTTVKCIQKHQYQVTIIAILFIPTHTSSTQLALHRPSTSLSNKTLHCVCWIIAVRPILDVTWSSVKSMRSKERLNESSVKRQS